MNCPKKPTPETSMRCGRELMLALLLLGAPAARAADPLSVDVVNASTPALCAETDNVYLKLQSAEVKRFTVEAAHPAYVGTIVKDQWAPDFTSCDMSSDPSFKFEKRRLTIYETEEWQLVGLTFPSFWRPIKFRSVSATASKPDSICSSSGRAMRSAPKRCWCSTPPTATGARGRCRRRTCAGAPTARRF